MSNFQEPLVSVCVRSHNQEKFIGQALESVLNQKTTFDYEIIVSDDHSTDATPQILKDYQHQNPDRMVLILGETNIGGPRNLRRVIESAKAPYVVCLDGDDYFTDSYKLQKQVDFLESHAEYAACFHNTWHVSENGVKKSLFNSPSFAERHDAHDFILKDWFVPIHSAMLRRQFIEFPDWYDTVMNDDYVVHLSVAKHGPYYFMPDVMVAYRHHENEISVAYRNRVFTYEQLSRVLTLMKPLYPIEYAADFDSRIAYYQSQISELKLLQSQPWRKWFRKSTYKTLIKKYL